MTGLDIDELVALPLQTSDNRWVIVTAPHAFNAERMCKLLNRRIHPSNPRMQYGNGMPPTLGKPRVVRARCWQSFGQVMANRRSKYSRRGGPFPLHRENWRWPGRFLPGDPGSPVRSSRSWYDRSRHAPCRDGTTRPMSACSKRRRLHRSEFFLLSKPAVRNYRFYAIHKFAGVFRGG